jgi:uncharacterized membrane protein (UPF0127 family)
VGTDPAGRRGVGAPAWLETLPGQRLALWGIVALLVVAAGSCFAVGASRPPAPEVLPAGATAGLSGPPATVSRVSGFGQIGFRIIGSASLQVGPARCALLASSEAEREQGMMGRRDLDGYAAMIFQFPSNSTASFYNKDVPIPLSVAWFDSVGVLVGSADLAVCPVTCPTVAPPLSYRLALEVPEGGLHHLGIGQGSVLLVGGSCAA